MKKRELLSLPELTATDEIVSLARNDRGRKKQIHYWRSGKVKVFRILYSRAAVADGILKVAFFCREDLLAGERRARYEVFISTEEGSDITYLPQEKRWSEARIGNQVVEDSYKCFSPTVMEEWEEPGALDAVNGYLYSDNTRGSVFNIIDMWQHNARICRLRGRHQREKERIDLAMEQVPALPSDWEDWVYKSAYSHAQYMMYHYGDKDNSAWCSACGREVHLKRKVKHQEQVRCPACGKKVLALSWNRQKVLVDTKKPAILQERKDCGYVLRIFDSRIRRGKTGDWKVDTSTSYIHEKYRIFLDKDFRQETIYEYTFWKNRYENELRWCYETAHGYGWYHAPAGEGILYYRNLAKLRKGTCLKYIPIEQLFRKNEGCFSYPVAQISVMKRVPQIEFLIKMKLYRLAWELTSRWDQAQALRVDVIDTGKRTPCGVLGLDRQQVEMAVKMNISVLQLKTLHTADELGIRLNRKQLEWYAKELGPEITRDVLINGHPVKSMNYIRKLQESKIRTGDYIDYLNDIRILQMERTEDVLYPKHFEAAHERLSAQRREREEHIKAEKIREKDRILASMLPGIRKIYGNYKDDSFVMVLPECKEDFNREGRENHNCVGGSYYDKMLEGKCVVLFLRRNDEPEKAFCTVEMNGTRVVQCRAIRNSDPPQEVKDFMERYRREVEKRIMRKNALERKDAGRIRPAI